MFQEPIHRSTFPSAWAEAITQPEGYGAMMPPAVPNPFASTNRPPDQPAAQAQMSHVHPWIANRMKEYHAHFRGRVMMSKILSGANATFDQLPVILEFINQSTNKNELCYNHVMGVCSNRRCWYQHASKAQIPNSFAGDLIQMCWPGIDYVVRNEPNGGGRGQQERRSEGNYYGRAAVTSGSGGQARNAEVGSDGKRGQRDQQPRYDNSGKQQRRT